MGEEGVIVIKPRHDSFDEIGVFEIVKGAATKGDELFDALHVVLEGFYVAVDDLNIFVSSYLKGRDGAT